MAISNLIKVKVQDAQDILYEGEVERISSYNEVGPFDIYPMHANFISIIRKELSLYQEKKMVKHIEFELAVLKVRSDVVSIFLGIEVMTLEDDVTVNEMGVNQT